MDDFVVCLVAQNFFNPACMQSFDLIQLLRAVVDQAPSELATFEIDATDALADAKGTANLFQSRRQEALPLLHHTHTRTSTGTATLFQSGREEVFALLHPSIMRALIDDDLAGRFQVVSDPMLPAGQPI